MSTVTTGLYEEDLTGTNPLNKIPDERQTLVTPGKDDFYFIIPHAAPFFVDSLVVTLEATGQELDEGEDYQIGHKFIEAMKSTGRTIAGSIRIMKREIQGIVKLEYRTIGGVWGFSDAAIIAELGRRQYNPLVRTWGAIDVLPYSFPSLDHAQPIDTGLVGSVELLAGLTRIADVLEATASGTTESHLIDFNNPHKVNKAQVDLANVQNYAMATNAEAAAGTRSDLYISPAGVVLTINQHILPRLLAHINDQGNPHGVNPTQLGLDKVPNYPAATDAQAIDPVNNSVLMTPYTTALMIQTMSGAADLTQLTNRLNAHVNDFNNPHQTHPHDLIDGGAYTRTEIDQKLLNVAATDTPKFNGMTDTEWRETLPSFDDLSFLCDELTAAFGEAEQVISQLNPSDPVTPAEQLAREMRKLQGALAAYSMYSAFNGLWNSVLVTSSDLTQFPSNMPDSQNKWAQLENAGYYVDANGAIVAFGSEAVPTPANMAPGVGFDPTKAVDMLYATKGIVWAQLADGDEAPTGLSFGSVVRYTSAGVVQQYATTDEVVSIWTGTGHKYPEELVLVELNSGVIVARGNAQWVSAATSVINNIRLTDAQVMDVRICDDYVIFLTESFHVRVYEIRRTPNITLVEQAALQARNVVTGQMVTIKTMERVLKIAGSYGHFGLIVSPGFQPAPNDSMLIASGELYMFGSDNRYDQQTIPTAGPFLDVACGNGFTVTISVANAVEFWGNSPDNALLFNHRSLP